jgi:hypothetical protein
MVIFAILISAMASEEVLLAKSWRLQAQRSEILVGGRDGVCVACTDRALGGGMAGTRGSLVRRRHGRPSRRRF